MLEPDSQSQHELESLFASLLHCLSVKIKKWPGMMVLIQEVRIMKLC